MGDLLKILIVDDEEELVATLQERLEIRGFQVTGVLSGKDALDRAAKESFDVVLMDVRLKGEDGIEVMGRLKAVLPNLPVILLTGHISQSPGDAELKAGAADTIIKPIQLSELIKIMEDVVSNAQKALEAE
jgi:DNA-binding NtrC family response regulator